MSEGWSRKHVVSGDHSHVQRRERVRPRRAKGCGGRAELGDSISLRRGGTTTTGRREREKFTKHACGNEEEERSTPHWWESGNVEKHTSPVEGVRVKTIPTLLTYRSSDVIPSINAVTRHYTTFSTERHTRRKVLRFRAAHCLSTAAGVR